MLYWACQFCGMHAVGAGRRLLGAALSHRTRLAEGAALLHLQPHRCPRLIRALAQMASNQQVVEGLEPQPLWKFFAQLSEIPRPSKHEGRVIEWLKDFAQQRGLEHQQDAVGNIVIRRAGSGGGEQAPPVVIQGHVDMVCEKNVDVCHDFMHDPIRLHLEGDWLKAQGTTLGSDNGIGVAAALALLDSPPATLLPPLECLFTVDEETGLTGAAQIDPGLLRGRTMLNLDTEDWGEVFIGCAGGGDSKLQLDVQLVPANTQLQPVQVKLGGLLGGHSGLNIAEGRGNAVQLLGRVLRQVVTQVPGAQVASLSGGDKRNAIAREARAVLLVQPGQQQALTQLVDKAASEFKDEYGRLEKDLFALVEPWAEARPQHVISSPDLRRLLALVSILPHGPVKFSHDVPGLVETSSNLASIQLQHPDPHSSTATALLVTSTRSSLGPALEAVRDSIQEAASLAGARMERGQAYPGWQPRLDSHVLQLTCAAYAQMTGAQPKVGAIHAGLECGILGERFPGMDMVSFGPTIKGAHSPDERVQVSTVLPFYKLTCLVLEMLARRKA